MLIQDECKRSLKCFDSQTAMYAQNSVIRTYCPGVRVGNWFEGIALEEVGECHSSILAVLL